MDVKKTLNEREGQYGYYKTVGEISQGIKAIMRTSPNYFIMPEYA